MGKIQAQFVQIQHPKINTHASLLFLCICLTHGYYPEELMFLITTEEEQFGQSHCSYQDLWIQVCWWWWGWILETDANKGAMMRVKSEEDEDVWVSGEHKETDWTSLICWGRGWKFIWRVIFSTQGWFYFDKQFLSTLKVKRLTEFQRQKSLFFSFYLLFVWGGECLLFFFNFTPPLLPPPLLMVSTSVSRCCQIVE